MSTIAVGRGVVSDKRNFHTSVDTLYAFYKRRVLMPLCVPMMIAGTVFTLKNGMDFSLISQAFSTSCQPFSVVSLLWLKGSDDVMAQIVTTRR